MQGVIGNKSKSYFTLSLLVNMIMSKAELWIRIEIASRSKFESILHFDPQPWFKALLTNELKGSVYNSVRAVNLPHLFLYTSKISLSAVNFRKLVFAF